MRSLARCIVALLSVVPYCTSSTDSNNGINRLAIAKFRFTDNGLAYGAKFSLLLSDRREEQLNSPGTTLAKITRRMNVLRLAHPQLTSPTGSIGRKNSTRSVVSEGHVIDNSELASTAVSVRLPHGAKLVSIHLVALYPVTVEENALDAVSRNLIRIHPLIDINGIIHVDLAAYDMPVIALRIEYKGPVTPLDINEGLAESTLASGGLWRYKAVTGATTGLQRESVYPSVTDSSGASLAPRTIDLRVTHSIQRSLICQATPMRTPKGSAYVRSQASLTVNQDPNGISWLLVPEDSVMQERTHPVVVIPHAAFLLRSRMPGCYVATASTDERDIEFGLARASLAWRSLGTLYDAWLLDAYAVYRARLAWSSELALRADERADAKPLAIYSSSRAAAAKGAAILSMISGQCTAIYELDIAELPLTLEDLLENAARACFASEPLRRSIPPWITQRGHPVVTVDIEQTNDCTFVIVQQHPPALHDAEAVWPIPISIYDVDGTMLASAVLTGRSTRIPVPAARVLQPINYSRRLGFFRVRYTAIASKHFNLSFDAEAVLADAFATATLADYPSLFATVAAVLDACAPCKAPELWRHVRESFTRFFMADSGQALSVRRPVYQALQETLRNIVEGLSPDPFGECNISAKATTTVDTESVDFISDTGSKPSSPHSLRGIAILDNEVETINHGDGSNRNVNRLRAKSQSVPDVLATDETLREVMSTLFGLQLETADKAAIATAQRLFFDHVSGVCVLSGPLLDDVLRAAEVYGEEGEWHLVAQLCSGWRQPGDTFPRRVARYSSRIARATCYTVCCRPCEALVHLGNHARYIGGFYVNWFCDMAWWIMKSATMAYAPIRPYWDAWYSMTNEMLGHFGLIYLCYNTVEPQDNATAWSILVLYRVLLYYWLGYQFYMLVEGQRQAMAGWTDRSAISAAIASDSRGESRWVCNAARGSPAAWRTLIVSYDRFARKKRVRIERFKEPNMGFLDEDSDDDDRRIDREFM